MTSGGLTPRESEDLSDDEPFSFDDVVAPRAIVIAVRLMRVGACLSVVVLAFAFLSVSSIKANIAGQLREQHQYSPAEVDSVYQNLVASTVAVSVLAAAMWLWMARLNGAGRKWARTTATVLGAFNIGEFALSLSQGEITLVQLTVSGLSVVLAAAILVLLWRSESSDFYWARSRRAAAPDSADSTGSSD